MELIIPFPLTLPDEPLPLDQLETMIHSWGLTIQQHALAAAWQILRFRRARREIGPWILAAGLLLLHLEWWPQSGLPAEVLT